MFEFEDDCRLRCNCPLCLFKIRAYQTTLIANITVTYVYRLKVTVFQAPAMVSRPAVVSSYVARPISPTTTNTTPSRLRDQPVTALQTPPKQTNTLRGRETTAAVSSESAVARTRVLPVENGRPPEKALVELAAGPPPPPRLVAPWRRQETAAVKGGAETEEDVYEFSGM